MKRKILIALVSAALVGVTLLQVVPALADTPNPLDHVLISPTGATLPVAGAQQFSAQAYGTGNQPLSNVTYFWLVAAGGGTINPTGATGLFVAGAIPGTYANTVEVLAVQGNIVKMATASVTVTGTPGNLDRVTITPSNATLIPGGTQQFVAQAYDINNVAIAGLNYGWSLASGSGTIASVNNNAMTFAAGTATGTFVNTVQATASQITAQGTINRTGTASVTVTLPTQPASTPTPTFDANKLIKMFSSFLRGAGFDNFLGGQWQVKSGTVVDTIRLIPGVVQAAPSATSQTLTVMPAGQTTATPFTIGANVVIQPKGTALAVNQKVVIVTVNDVVSMVVVIMPSATTGQMPPGLRKQDEDKRGGKQTPPGWSHGKKTGWGEKSGNGNSQSENDD